ncbi:MAG TPA: hypothetical protein VF601_08925 [Beijerinckiaceae bacterium]|jgi:hypothetical protein
MMSGKNTNGVAVMPVVLGNGRRLRPVPGGLRRRLGLRRPARAGRARPRRERRRRRGAEDSPVYFNVDGDAAIEKTAWTGRNDGFRVVDLSADGGSGADGAITQLKEPSFAAWTTPTPRSVVFLP